MKRQLLRRVRFSSRVGELGRELAVWLAFVPFMSVDLRAKFDSRVFATDASSRSCAAVVSQLPVGLVQEIWRFRPRRGVGQRFDIVGRERVDSASSSESDVCSESDDDPGDSRWASELCTAVGWQPVFRYTVRRSEHIVTKEARPICTLIRHLASEVRSGGSRVVNFADSSPNIDAWAKGRSSSGRLGRHLRQVAPDLLLTDLQIAVATADCVSENRLPTDRSAQFGSPSTIASVRFTFRIVVDFVTRSRIDVLTSDNVVALPDTAARAKPPDLLYETNGQLRNHSSA